MKNTEVVRPHDQRCRLCVEYDLSGAPLITAGHYVCQADGCSGLADFTWVKLTSAGSQSVMACQVHRVPEEKLDKTHTEWCVAPDAACNCC